MEQLVVERTNDFRRQQGLEPVGRDPVLERSARYFAQFMAKTDKYGHTADGNEPAARAKVRGYDYCLVSENISYQYSSAGFATAELARRYVEGWKDSPGHRKNMLEEAALHTGIAVAKSESSGRYYAVQMFGRPKSASVEFRIRNASRDTVRYRLDEEAFSLASGAARIHQRCGTPDLRVQGMAKAARPAHGERLAVAKEPGGRVVLRAER